MEEIDNHFQNKHVKVMETKMFEHFQFWSTVGPSRNIYFQDPEAML